MKKLKSVNKVNLPNGAYYYTFEEGEKEIMLKAYGKDIVLILDDFIVKPEHPCTAEMKDGIATINAE